MGADVSASNSRGQTALILACTSGSLEAVEAILQAGADVNTAAGDGTTPLMAAAMRGELLIVERLIAGGVNAVAVDGDGQTALMKACQAGNRYSYCDLVIKALLAAGADVNGAAYTYGRTPLLMACNWAQEDLITFLLEAGADTRATSKGGKTALMLIAAVNKNKHYSDIFDVLVQGGVDLHTVDDEGRSAARIAVESDNWRVLDLLKGAGVTPSAGACYRSLIAAYDEDKLELVEKLLASGAAVDLKDVKTRAVLIPPAAKGDLEEINRLLREGALVDATAFNWKPDTEWDGEVLDRTALLCAARHGSVPAVSSLLEASANVNYLQGHGWPIGPDAGIDARARRCRTPPPGGFAGPGCSVG